MIEDFINHFINELSISTYVLLGSFVLFLFVQLYYYFRYFNGIIKQSRKIVNKKVKDSTAQPPVSVIICAQNEADNLEKYLPSVLEQKYPKFEVIVVNDGSTDQSADLLEQLDKKYDNLYHTFLPMDAKYMSRKKMCLAVGIKAAKYDHLLLLDADCEPTDQFWISNMMRNYLDGKEIVLGYSKHAGAKGFLEKIIRYDSITNAMRFMGYALAGNAYRGLGRNLSYKKDLFFNSTGFSTHLNLTAGDDSLFIQQVATESNVNVEFSKSSITLAHREESNKSYLYQKGEQLKTLSKYKSGILASFATEIGSRLLFYILFGILATLFIIEQEWILAGCIGILFLIRYISQIVIFRKSATILNEKKMFLLIPIFDILLPLIAGYIQTFGKIGSKKDNFFRC